MGHRHTPQVGGVRVGDPLYAYGIVYRNMVYLYPVCSALRDVKAAKKEIEDLIFTHRVFAADDVEKMDPMLATLTVGDLVHGSSEQITMLRRELRLNFLNRRPFHWERICPGHVKMSGLFQNYEAMDLKQQEEINACVTCMKDKAGCISKFNSMMREPVLFLQVMIACGELPKSREFMYEIVSNYDYPLVCECCGEAPLYAVYDTTSKYVSGLPFYMCDPAVVD